MKNFWNKLKKPIICLSPMDGFTDSAFRKVCKDVNPNLIVVTEFTSTDGLHYAPDKVKERLNYHESELPIIAQIYGNNNETFAEAAKLCEELGFSGIDINMGCPAKKVVKSEQGVALRKQHDKAFKLVETVAKSTKLAVSVKTRLGWTDASDLIEFGRGVQNAGAQLISIHGRTYAEPYNCPADFEPIYELKKELDILVLGNGGITSLQDGLDKLGNLDGFLIGQAAIGNPWIFGDKDFVQPKTFTEKVPLITKHIQYLIEEKGEELAVLQIRKHLLAYVKGMQGASKFRTKLASMTSFEKINIVLNEIKKSS